MEKVSRLHLLLLALVFTLALPGVSFAQNLKVQGCVTDEQNEPLIGVSVQTKDKTKGTVTDIDGNYVLSGVPQGATLVFSYVGYMPKEVKATSAHIDVVMDQSNEQLDEMVVIGYGQQRKVTLTGSVANLGGKELLKSPAASLGNALSGKLPGLQSVQYTGVPGADDPVIRIRGVGSFNSAEPLVLVDGVEREFSQIDPNEVQDISILKDASATAEYVATVIDARKSEKIGSVLKHFPGYGNNTDTHNGIAYDERTYEEFVNSDFLPFSAGISHGADIVLVSHNIVNCFDADYPASLSPKVHEILREQLGFDGVIITDDLFMNAIKDFTDNDSAAVLAVKAGNDLICCKDFEEQIPAVLQAVQNGEITEERLDESVLRILNLKINLGLLE